MDEDELRQAATELLLIELLSLIPPETLDLLSASIREGLAQAGEPGHGGDEYTIRKHTLELITDARMRRQLFTETPGGRLGATVRRQRRRASRLIRPDVAALQRLITYHRYRLARSALTCH